MTPDTDTHDNLDCYSDYTVELLTPCSSGATAVYDEDDEEPQQETTRDKVVVQLPNLQDTVNIAIKDVEDFINSYAPLKTPLLVIHLIIYLYHIKPDPRINTISDIKLLHMGKQYAISRPAYRQWDQTSLHSITSSFNKFQMIVAAPNPALPPVNLTLSQLVQRSFAPRSEAAVTYADAMIRKIKNASRKRSLLISSANSTFGVAPFRSSLVDLSTDVEESSSLKVPQKLRVSLKRVMRCVSVM